MCARCDTKPARSRSHCAPRTREGPVSRTAADSRRVFFVFAAVSSPEAVLTLPLRGDTEVQRRMDSGGW